MNPEKSFAQYRNAYNQSCVVSGHCIPYLGVYLTDLVFIEEATLSRVGGEDSGEEQKEKVSFFCLFVCFERTWMFFVNRKQQGFWRANQCSKACCSVQHSRKINGAKTQVSDSP